MASSSAYSTLISFIREWYQGLTRQQQIFYLSCVVVISGISALMMRSMPTPSFPTYNPSSTYTKTRVEKMHVVIPGGSTSDLTTTESTITSSMKE